MMRDKRFLTTLVAAFFLFVSSLIIGLTPTRFVAWQPGQAVDILGSDSAQALKIEGAATYETSGQLLLTTVKATGSNSNLSLAQALIAYFKKDSQVLPRSYVAPLEPSSSSKKTRDRLEDERNKQMSESQDAALVAALKLAGLPVEQTVQVTRVSNSGPASDKLAVGDTILSMNGTSIKKKADIQTILGTLRPGDELEIVLNRKGEEITVKVPTVAGKENPQAARLGVEFSESYKHAASVKFKLDSEISGSSAGLPFALGAYDLLTPEPVIDGRVVAGTGKILPSGEVSAVGGIRQKISAAEDAGAEIFLIPAGNCVDVEGKTSMRLVKITKLGDAVSSLKLLKDPANNEMVPTC